MGKGRKSTKQARKQMVPLDSWQSLSSYTFENPEGKKGSSLRDPGAKTLKIGESELKQISCAHDGQSGIVQSIPEVRLLADTVRNELGIYELGSRSVYRSDSLPGGFIIGSEAFRPHCRRPTLGQLFYDNHMIRKLCIHFALFVYPRVHDLRVGSMDLQKPRSGNCVHGPIGRRKRASSIFRL